MNLDTRGIVQQDRRSLSDPSDPQNGVDYAQVPRSPPTEI